MARQLPDGTVDARPVGFLARLGELSAFTTLIVVIGAAVAVVDRVNNLEERLTARVVQLELDLTERLISLEAQTDKNCRGINSAIILTLEAGRPDARRSGTEADLDRIITRFQTLAADC